VSTEAWTLVVVLVAAGAVVGYTLTEVWSTLLKFAGNKSTKISSGMY
jgi:hypothetical protein